jgi:catalase
MTRGDLSEQLVDALRGLFGEHPGYRAAHAKGICCAGTFTATPAAAGLTRAAHMQGDAVPITVRFSNGSGNPHAPDAARDARGMAVKFQLPGGETTDVVAITLPIFPARTPEDFLELTRARRPDPATGQPDMAKVAAFMAAHPESQRALGLSLAALPPASYAQAVYHAIHAFRFINAAGQERLVRYSWRPEAGVATISEDEARGRARDYLQLELRERLAAGPVGFTLHLQLAGQGDDVNDPTTAWPEDRCSVVAGRLEITRLVSDQQGGCEALIFDPTRVIDGIVRSDDRILNARPGAYSESYARRGAPRTG